MIFSPICNNIITGEYRLGGVPVYFDRNLGYYQSGNYTKATYFITGPSTLNKFRIDFLSGHNNIKIYLSLSHGHDKVVNYIYITWLRCLVEVRLLKGEWREQVGITTGVEHLLGLKHPRHTAHVEQASTLFVILFICKKITYLSITNANSNICYL